MIIFIHHQLLLVEQVKKKDITISTSDHVICSVILEESPCPPLYTIHPLYTTSSNGSNRENTMSLASAV